MTAKSSPALIFGAVIISFAFGITFTNTLYTFPVLLDTAFTLVVPTLSPLITPFSLTVTISVFMLV